MRTLRVLLAGVGATLALLPASAVSAASTSHTYTESGQVLRWNPCRTVPVRVNLRWAPHGALADVKGALARLDAVSGLHLRYAGPTKAVPSGSNYTHYAGITVAWAPNSRTDLLTGSNAGEGGFWANWNGHWKITSGFVVLDTRYNGLPGGFGRGVTRGELLLHEFGHSVGLGHVTDRSQIMYPLITDKRARYAAGDRAGLHRVGAAHGCLS